MKTTLMLVLILPFLLVPLSAISAPIKTKTVCYTRLDKMKKPVKQCKIIKVHKKLNGTKIPPK
jgi:hypothetical protein